MSKFDLQLFAAPYQGSNVQKTSQQSMSVTQKTFYDTALLENARSAMVYDQFGKKTKIKGGKAEWRKFNTFAKALTPLTEGAIPDGSNFGMTKIEAEVSQYGDYTTISDRLELESYDPIVYGATEEMGAAAGETYDTLTRNSLLTGTNVFYVPSRPGDGTTVTVSTRANIVATCLLTPADVRKVATIMEKNKVPKLNGYYVWIIHPSVAHDLTAHPDYIDYHKHCDVQPIFKGEIGELFGVRFIKDTNAKIFKDSSQGAIATYANIVVGKDAYGIVEPEGEGTEMIIKDREKAGGPLNQFSTIGYKFCHAAKILYSERLLRVECASSFSSEDSAN